MHSKFYFTFILIQLLNSTPVYSKTELDDSSLRKALSNGIAFGIPGISVAVGRGDEIIWTGTAGYSDLLSKRHVKPTDLFGIGSITKSFVASIILQLSAEGKLDLNKTAADYLDDEVIGKVANAKVAPLKTLLNHQSGIPSWEFEAEWIRSGRGDRMNLKHVWGKAETLDYIANGKAVAEFAPGERYSYSNTNYTLLGLVVEAVTGRALSSEIRERLLGPLEMRQTFMESFEPRIKGYVHHYHYDSPSFKNSAGVHSDFAKVAPHLIETTAGNLSPEWAAGGLVCSASDLVRWAQATRDGKVIGIPVRDALLDYSPPNQPPRKGFSYSQGICRIENFHSGKTFVGHSGGTLGFTGMMYWIEDTDLAIVCLMNVGTMHSGLDCSPPSEFFSKILVPSVLKFAGK